MVSALKERGVTISVLQECFDDIKKQCSELLELLERSCALAKGDAAINWLLECVSRERSKAQECLAMQSESALMQYNELHSRSVEVGAMAMNFEQRVADEVAKAGFRAKPGPKRKKEGQHLRSEWPDGHRSCATRGLICYFSVARDGLLYIKA
jgi:hypothetical protein